MHLSTSKEALIIPLAIVAGAADTKGSRPLLGTTLIKATAGRLSLLCSDGSVLARALTDCNVTKEGELAVDARRFSDLIKAMPDKQSVSMSLDKGQLLVAAGGSKFRLPVHASKEYPKMLTEEGRLTINISAKRLGEMLETVSSAMAVNHSCQPLNGTLIAVRDGAMWAVATDGHRMMVARQVIEGSESVQPTELAISRKAAALARRLLGGSNGNVALIFGLSEVRLEFEGGTVMVCKTIEGKYPKWMGLLPKSPCHAKLENTKLREAVTMVCAALSGMATTGKASEADKRLANRTVSMIFSTTALSIDHSDLASCPVPTVNPDASNEQVSISIDFLADAIAVMPNDIRIGYEGGEKPISIQPSGEDWPLAVLMPRRV